MIRRCTPDDYTWIRETAALVYRELGDYGTIIPSWLDHPGVLAFVDVPDQGGPPRGFTLVGFYTPSNVATGRDDDMCIGDLLAIGVEPQHQRQGIGRELLNHAIGVVRAARAQRDVPEMRLTVAEGNAPALALFEQHGFCVLDADYGSYDGGQRAIRMSLKL